MSKLVDYVFFVGLALMLVDASLSGRSFPGPLAGFGIMLFLGAFVAQAVLVMGKGVAGAVGSSTNAASTENMPRSSVSLPPLQLPDGMTAEPAPETMQGYAREDEVGSTHHFVLGPVDPGGPGSLWGTDSYAAGSRIAKAAIHAGVLAPGESGVVAVSVTAPQDSYAGSTRNSLSSLDYSGPRIFGFTLARVPLPPT